MSGNICRCGAYPNIVAAIEQAMSARRERRSRAMNTFTYTRADDVADAVREIAADPAREVHRRRHQPARPDEGERRAAVAADRHHRLPCARSRTTRRRRAAHRRARDEHRPRLPRAGRASAIRCCRERHPRRRLAAAAQHGDDRRQPAAADALPVFLRHRHAVQQARAGQRLLGHRRLQPHPRDPRHERALHRHAPVRHVRRPGRPGGASCG